MGKERNEVGAVVLGDLPLEGVLAGRARGWMLDFPLIKPPK